MFFSDFSELFLHLTALEFGSWVISFLLSLQCMGFFLVSDTGEGSFGFKQSPTKEVVGEGLEEREMRSILLIVDLKRGKL